MVLSCTKLVGRCSQMVPTKMVMLSHLDGGPNNDTAKVSGLPCAHTRPGSPPIHVWPTDGADVPHR